jgi:hypothetical protein
MAKAVQHTRNQLVLLIHQFIMRSKDPALDALHLYWAVQDGEKDRMKKDGKKPMDPEAFAKALGL